MDSAFECWVDDAFVGYSTDSRLPAEFDITAIIKERYAGQAFAEWGRGGGGQGGCLVRSLKVS